MSAWQTNVYIAINALGLTNFKAWILAPNEPVVNLLRESFEGSLDSFNLLFHSVLIAIFSLLQLKVLCLNRKSVPSLLTFHACKNGCLCLFSKSQYSDVCGNTKLIRSFAFRLQAPFQNNQSRLLLTLLGAAFVLRWKIFQED